MTRHHVEVRLATAPVNPAAGDGLTGPPEWVDEAKCAAAGPADHVWFPADGVNIRDARKICKGCPVGNECLTYALDTDQRHGVWGGLAPHERRRIKRRRCRRCGAQREPGTSYCPACARERRLETWRARDEQRRLERPA